jgi:hypothetical protein
MTMQRTLGAGRAWGHVAPAHGLVSAVARSLQVRDATAEHLLWDPAQAVNLRCATIVDAFHAAAPPELLAKWMAPIDLALTRAQAQPLGLALEVAEQEADGAEDVTRTALLLARTPANRAVWLRRARAHVAALTALIRAEELAATG